jgi:hypothetical protein
LGPNKIEQRHPREEERVAAALVTVDAREEERRLPNCLGHLGPLFRATIFGRMKTVACYERLREEKRAVRSLKLV